MDASAFASDTLFSGLVAAPVAELPPICPTTFACIDCACCSETIFEGKQAPSENLARGCNIPTAAVWRTHKVRAHVIRCLGPACSSALLGHLPCAGKSLQRFQDQGQDRHAYLLSAQWKRSGNSRAFPTLARTAVLCGHWWSAVVVRLYCWSLAAHYAALLRLHSALHCVI